MEAHEMERLQKTRVWRLVSRSWAATQDHFERVQALCTEHTDFRMKLRKALRSAKRWGGKLSLLGHDVTCEEDIPIIFGCTLNGSVVDAVLFVTEFEHALDLENSALKKKNGCVRWVRHAQPF